MWYIGLVVLPHVESSQSRDRTWVLCIGKQIPIHCPSRASRVAQLVKNPPTMQETPVRFLGWEDPLEKRQAARSSIHGLPWWLYHLMVNSPPAMRETWVRSLGWKDPLEEGMATHSSILAWRIPWTEEPGWGYSAWSHRVRHN